MLPGREHVIFRNVTAKLSTSLPLSAGKKKKVRIGHGGPAGSSYIDLDGKKTKSSFSSFMTRMSSGLLPSRQHYGAPRDGATAAKQIPSLPFASALAQAAPA